MPSQFSLWIEASRPKTLAAAFVPVLIGAVLAYKNNSFLLPASLVALWCAFLIQIGTNFANDYFDFIKGADTSERIGFKRATAEGLIPPKNMLAATIITMSLAFISGIYLIYLGGWVILLIGVLSLFFGIIYTGGPFPLAYNGLGDLFVFVFFGVIAVMGTYYVNALEWSMDAFWASLAVGALSTNILVVNNLRDVHQDRKAGKKTLGVIFGENVLKTEYTLMTLLAFAIPPHFYFQLKYDWLVLLPLLLFPFALFLNIRVWREADKRALNPVLEKTAAFMALFGFLFALSIYLG